MPGNSVDKGRPLCIRQGYARAVRQPHLKRRMQLTVHMYWPGQLDHPTTFLTSMGHILL